MLPLLATVAGDALCVTARSAEAALTVVAAEALSFVLLLSNVPVAALLAAVVTEPVAVGVTLTTMFAAAPVPRLVAVQVRAAALKPHDQGMPVVLPLYVRFAG